jgi:hypothetical protein
MPPDSGENVAHSARVRWQRSHSAIRSASSRSAPSSPSGGAVRPDSVAISRIPFPASGVQLRRRAPRFWSHAVPPGSCPESRAPRSRALALPLPDRARAGPMGPECYDKSALRAPGAKRGAIATARARGGPAQLSGADCHDAPGGGALPRRKVYRHHHSGRNARCRQRVSFRNGIRAPVDREPAPGIVGPDRVKRCRALFVRVTPCREPLRCPAEYFERCSVYALPLPR